MSKNIRYVKKIPIMKFFLGITLFVFGILAALGGSIFILIISGIGVFLMLSEGSEFNLESKKYREFYSLFGFDFGKWKDLPEIEYVSVFNTFENSRVQGMGASANFKNKIIKLNLFYDRNKKIEVYKTEDIDDAFEMAKQISQILNIEIYDAT